ncbi:sigma-70 family RNA polymerase sigma factor [Bacillus pumilus]|uniref:sigma-70 family RNA polymerase sigma factor n=1 Tax=Bacillus pumilus TaxID=1408 RepID=UPI00203C5F05|nr:sigma-70 family RNA polymerase sigma factor [Bacillus pumilus]MCM3149873.1 sigma-70 family RNA polymerase sigma factor [Bacillus pumilus]
MKHVRLIKKAQKGNVPAFEKLMLMYQERLYKTAFLYTRNKEDSLDAVQETVLKAFKHLSGLKEPTYFSSWLTRILIHTIFAMKKRQQDVVPFEQQHESVERNDFLEDKLDLKHALDVLDEQYQIVIQLFYFQDYSISMISQQMGMPEGTIKTHLYRARKLLKQTLEKEESVDGTKRNEKAL